MHDVMIHYLVGIILFFFATLICNAQEDPCTAFKPSRMQTVHPKDSISRSGEKVKNDIKLQWSQIINVRIRRDDIAANANLQTAYLFDGDYRFSLVYKKKREDYQREISIHDETRFSGKPDSLIVQADRLNIKVKLAYGKEKKIKTISSAEIETRKTPQFETIKSKENEQRSLKAAFLNPATLYLIGGVELPINEKSHIELGLSGARIRFITQEELRKMPNISEALKERGIAYEGGTALSSQLNYVWIKKLKLNQRARFFVPFTAENAKEFEIDNRISYAASKTIETSWRCQWRYDSSRYPPVSWINTMDIGFKFGNH